MTLDEKDNAVRTCFWFAYGFDPLKMPGFGWHRWRERHPLMIWLLIHVYQFNLVEVV